MRFAFIVILLFWRSDATQLCTDADGVKLSRLVESQRSMPAEAMQSAVRKTIEDTWCAYRAHAWGRDTLMPVSGSGSDWVHLATTAADALDTLMMARLDPHAAETKSLLVGAFKGARKPAVVSAYNLVASVLGGLISAHALSKDTLVLQMAASLADNVSVVFDAPSEIPHSSVNLLMRRARAVSKYNLLSEAGSFRMEYDALSDAMGSRNRYGPPTRAQHSLIGSFVDGLVPSTMINIETAEADGNALVTIGRGSGAFYGGLLKSWIQNGRTDATLRAAHQDFVHGVTTRLLRRSPEEDLLYITSIKDGEDTFSMDQSACFYPGILALADMHGVGTRSDHVLEEDDVLMGLSVLDQLEIAEELMDTCMAMIDRTATGLAPERVSFRNTGNATWLQGDMWIPSGSESGSIRPEIAESLLYVYSVTRKAEYRAAGWDMWRAIQRNSRVPSGKGYSSVWNVNELPVRRKDRMETWFLAGTLKYLYLLFGEGNVNLETIVFSSGGHAFPVKQTRREDL